MSLAQPPSFQSPSYNPTPGFNPFGPNAILGSEQIQARISPGPRGEILAPQGRVPTNVLTLAPPPSLSRPESRPDFTRGFGLDTTEEEEEPPEDELIGTEAENSREEIDMLSTIAEGGREDGFETEMDGMSTVAQSRIHSRHVSKLSAALSLHSVGRTDGPTTLGVDASSNNPYALPPLRSPVGEFDIEDADADADVDEAAADDGIGEWTGSEDLGTGADSSDDEVSADNAYPISERCLFIFFQIHFRVLVNGQTHLMKKEHVRNALTAVPVARRAVQVSSNTI